MKTYTAKPGDVRRDWYIIDADNQTLGRLATKVASYLRGKHKVSFTPHIDTGDFIIVINASKVHLTGDKINKKMYWRHSGYPGGIKGENAAKILEKFPERLIFQAVRGMLPKNRIGRALLKKLKVYRRNEHPHQAQKPIFLSQQPR